MLGLDRYARPLRAIRIALAHRADMLVIGVVMMMMLLFFAGIAAYAFFKVGQLALGKDDFKQALGATAATHR